MAERGAIGGAHNASLFLRLAGRPMKPIHPRLFQYCQCTRLRCPVYDNRVRNTRPSVQSGQDCGGNSTVGAVRLVPGRLRIGPLAGSRIPTPPCILPSPATGTGFETPCLSATSTGTKVRTERGSRLWSRAIPSPDPASELTEFKANHSERKMLLLGMLRMLLIQANFLRKSPAMLYVHTARALQPD